MDNATAKLVDRQLSLLFDRYQTKSRAFYRLFYGLLGFSIIFTLLILLPYISIEYERSALRDDLETINTQIAERKAIIDKYQEALTGIDTLEQTIKDAPNQLRLFLSQPTERTDSSDDNPNQTPPETNQAQSGSTDPQDPAFQIQSGVTVDTYINKMFQDFSTILTAQVLKPMQELQKTPTPTMQANEKVGQPAVSTQRVENLKQGIDSLEVTFKQRYQANPDFWQSFDSKTAFFDDTIQDAVQEFWEESGIETDQQMMDQVLKELQANKQEIEDRSERLQNREKEIESRLDRIELPIGNLPVSVMEAVFLFPVLIAVTFLLCVLSFRETVVLREAYRVLYQQKDEAQVVLNDRQISLTSPLWIDPLQPKQTQRMKLAVFLLPIVVFVLVVIVLGAGWFQWGLDDKLNVLDTMTYAILYGVSAICFFIGTYKLFTRDKITEDTNGTESN